MAHRSRALRSPFIVSITAIAGVSAIACGGQTDIGNPPPTGTGATGGTGSGGTAGATGGTAGATGGGAGTAGSAGFGGSAGTAGSAGTGGNPGTCPADLPSSWETCATKGEACKYTVACQSGSVTFTLNCSSTGYWDLLPAPCAKPYDSCPGTELYCGDGGWVMPQGTNPPSPCPAEKPAVGAKCYAGGFGGVWEHCGYPCDPTTKTGWTIATCPMADGQNATWSDDGACK